MIYELNEKFMI